MYTSFQVSDFRCFSRLRIDELELVNLIAGKNNVGKTALLEALFVHSAAPNPELVLRLDALRGITELRIRFRRVQETLWESWFREFDTSRVIELVGEYGRGRRRTVKLSTVSEADAVDVHLDRLFPPEDDQMALSTEAVAKVLQVSYEDQGEKPEMRYLKIEGGRIRIRPHPAPPAAPAYFLAAQERPDLEKLAERFGQLEMNKRQDVLKDALKVIEPRLKELSVILTGGRPIIHGDIGLQRLVPLPLMGGGIARLATLVLAISDAENGVVLVDEIENGIHYSVLQNMWRVVAQAARESNTQVFATTHSLECINAAHQVFSEERPEDFRLHRLDSDLDEIRAVAYGASSLSAAIDSDLEVR